MTKSETTDKQRIERLRAVLAEALREKNVSEDSIPEFIRHVEEGTSDDEVGAIYEN